VFELQVTDPLRTAGFLPMTCPLPFTAPVSLVIVAVNVTDCPYVDGLLFDETVTIDFACVAVTDSDAFADW
jgi:hypothetical protein